MKIIFKKQEEAIQGIAKELNNLQQKMEELHNLPIDIHIIRKSIVDTLTAGRKPKKIVLCPLYYSHIKDKLQSFVRCINTDARGNIFFDGVRLEMDGFLFRGWYIR